MLFIISFVSPLSIFDFLGSFQILSLHLSLSYAVNDSKKEGGEKNKATKEDKSATINCSSHLQIFDCNKIAISYLVCF